MEKEIKLTLRCRWSLIRRCKPHWVSISHHSMRSPALTCIYLPNQSKELKKLERVSKSYLGWIRCNLLGKKHTEGIKGWAGVRNHCWKRWCCKQWWCLEDNNWCLLTCTWPHWHMEVYSIWHSASEGTYWHLMCLQSSCAGLSTKHVLILMVKSAVLTAATPQGHLFPTQGLLGIGRSCLV